MYVMFHMLGDSAKEQSRIHPSFCGRYNSGDSENIFLTRASRSMSAKVVIVVHVVVLVVLETVYRNSKNAFTKV